MPIQTRRGIGVIVISQVPRTDGAQRDFVLRLFYFLKANMTLKTTPLNAAHRAMGAKMVDFGGWDMPVNYGSQIDEHHQVRNDVGMFDVCHMRVVDVKGANVRNFLCYLLANNAALQRSIRHRFPYIDPLHHLQVELVRRYRAGKADERVQRGIHISINGIAAGLRNTG